MNPLKFKSKMVLNGDTLQSLAGYVGITENSLTAKINKYPIKNFKLWEIVKISNKYNLTPEEIYEIFIED